jgi:hypothetical protein
MLMSCAQASVYPTFCLLRKGVARQSFGSSRTYARDLAGSFDTRGCRPGQRGIASDGAERGFATLHVQVVVQRLSPAFVRRGRDTHNITCHEI